MVTVLGTTKVIGLSTSKVFRLKSQKTGGEDVTRTGGLIKVVVGLISSSYTGLFMYVGVTDHIEV